MPKANEFPKRVQPDSWRSDDVCIDVDGWRITYVIGYYDFDRKMWMNNNGNEQDAIDQENLVWHYLNLSKYDRSN